MSKSLSETQRNYSQIEKEAFALITTVERFRKFERMFNLQTDHRPLLALFNIHNTKGVNSRTASRLRRWALRLINYDFEIEYVNTKDFGQADALSRLIDEARNENDPELEEVIANIQEVEDLIQVFYELLENVPMESRYRLKEMTIRDGVLTVVMFRIQTGWKDEDKTDHVLAPYYNRRDPLTVIDGTVMFEERVVIPIELQQHVMQELHRTRPGIRRMKQLSSILLLAKMFG